MPDHKELNFFASDLQIRRYYDTLSDYLAQFTCSDRTIAGEASTWYLYSTSAAQEIHRFNHNAKIVISLRNPTDMIYSLFRHRRYVGTEKADSLSHVLERESEYISNARNTMGIETAYIYSKAAMYYQQVRRYIETFGSASVHVVLFEDIKDNPKEMYRGILQFLGVDDDVRPSFCIVNKSGRIRSERLRQQLDHPPAAVKRVAYALPRRVRRTAYWTLRRLNTSYAPPPPLDRELRRRLNDEFGPDVERLSALIGRDLTHWLGE